MKETNEYAVVNRYRETIPVDIRGLCDELGVQVHSAFLDPDISGMLESKGNGRYKITVNASDRATRQRFTIAHELGHYILHRSLIGDGVDDDRAYRSTNKGIYHNTNIGPRQETEANKFAADVLMPWAQVKKYREACAGTPDQLVTKLAGQFQVSRQAMEIRLS